MIDSLSQFRRGPPLDMTSAQYAADFGNQQFRDYWINEAKSQLAAGYKGLFVDDVNLDWRVGNGSGATVYPINPRTGAQMTLADWRKSFAEFTEQIEIPRLGAEIGADPVQHVEQDVAP